MPTILKLLTTALNSLSGVLTAESYWKFSALKIAHLVEASNSPSYLALPQFFLARDQGKSLPRLHRVLVEGKRDQGS